MKGKKVIYIFVLFIAILSTVYSLLNFISSKEEIKETKKQLELVEEKKDRVSSELDISDRYDQYRREFNNNDIIGRLIIEGLDIDNLLVQTTDNDYYLRRLLDGTYNVMGSMFIDYRSDIESGRQINIYGHNSDIYDLPFRKLPNYLDRDFFLNNRTITLETLNGTKTFEIFSVKVITDDIEHTKILFDNDLDFYEHIKKLRSNSLYDSLDEVSGTDQILVLQTCLLNNTLGKYLIIIGRKV
mgnify:FL=1